MATQKHKRELSYYVLHRYTLQTIVLAVIVLGLSAVSLYAWQVGQAVSAIYNKASQAAANTPDFVHSKIYTDTTNIFTVQYPSNWRIVLSQPASEGVLPDWTKESRPFTFIPAHRTAANSNSSVGVISKPDESRRLAQSRADKFHTVQHQNINGYSAYLDRVVFIGPSSAEKYTDDYYFVEHGNLVLALSFRESYYHNYPVENWNDSSDVPTFRAIVNSVKFLR